MERDDIKLSPTALNLFTECERCFWLKYSRGEDRPSTPFPSLPSGMDREIKAYFDRHRERNRVPPELESSAIDAVPYPGGEFLEKCREWRSDPVYERDGAVLRGGVDDLLNTRGGKIVVMDYKTRGREPKRDEGVPSYYERQVNLYNLIMESNGHPTADFGLILYYYPEEVTGNGAISFHTEFREVELDLHHARNVFEDAVRTLQGGEPEPGDGCEFCAWRGKT